MLRRLQLLLTALLLPAAPLPAAAPAVPPLEYEVKAVCVLNVARFVEWPKTAFKDDSAPFVIGVLGDNPFGSLLEEAVKNETVRRRRIIVRSVTLTEAATGCQILFVSRSEKENLPAIFAAMEKSSALTISEIEGFTHEGGMLGLALEGGKIRFELNRHAAHAARLKIDSQFLMLCRITP
ncbi:MAG: hypothetical protein JWO89_158 [Verrucomicrobiaceae bacterium]|nr:hypothetical protein [Verrucomicrobiaceae bacterium]